MKKKIASDTRKLYHKIHNEQTKSIVILKKLISIFNNTKKVLPNKIFKNKTCCDLGCGNNGITGLGMLKDGAKKVYFVDYDSSVNKNLKKNLHKYSGKYEIINSDIQQKIFPDNHLDFVFCQGVIHHVEKDTLVLKNIFQSMKKSAKILLDVQGEGGLITKFINDVLRPEYKKNAILRRIIDNLINNKTNYSQILTYSLNNKEKKLFNKVSKYFDYDFLLTILDRVKSPKYKVYNEKKFKQKLTSIGFSKIRRVKRDLHFFNIRKIFSKVYKEYDHPLSRVLYGEGNIILLASK
jgi:ubiquinone/menaquinone biosynthesis C-methylase UbiE